MQTLDELKWVRKKYKQEHNNYEGGYRCAICWRPWIKEVHGDDCVVGALSNAIEQIEQLDALLKSTHDVMVQRGERAIALEAENEKLQRAAKLYLEHGEPELADELETLLEEQEDE